MSDLAYLKRLQGVIRKLHGAESRHVATIPITEVFQGKPVWEGEVEEFDLIDHPTAKTCYAWPFDESNKEQTTAVLKLPPVTSPETAVKAAIAASLRHVKDQFAKSIQSSEEAKKKMTVQEIFAQARRNSSNRHRNSSRVLGPGSLTKDGKRRIR
jgi:hypothetical protein